MKEYLSDFHHRGIWIMLSGWSYILIALYKLWTVYTHEAYQIYPIIISLEKIHTYQTTVLIMIILGYVKLYQPYIKSNYIASMCKLWAQMASDCKIDNKVNRQASFV